MLVLADSLLMTHPGECCVKNSGGQFLHHSWQLLGHEDTQKSAWKLTLSVFFCYWEIILLLTATWPESRGAMLVFKSFSTPAFDHPI